MADWIEGSPHYVYCANQWWNVDAYSEHTSFEGTTYATFLACPMTPPWSEEEDDNPWTEIYLKMSVPIAHIVAVAQDNM